MDRRTFVASVLGYGPIAVMLWALSKDVDRKNAMSRKGEEYVTTFGNLGTESQVLQATRKWQGIEVESPKQLYEDVEQGRLRLGDVVKVRRVDEPEFVSFAFQYVGSCVGDGRRMDLFSRGKGCKKVELSQMLEEYVPVARYAPFVGRRD